MNGETPDLRDVWENVNQSRIEIAELRGMIKMHFSDGTHHHPPCEAASNMQRTMLSATWAAVLALLAALGGLALEFVKK